MDKIKEDGYYAAIGTGVFGIIMLLFAWDMKFVDLTGQVSGVIGAFFILLSGASFLKPESAGQIAMRILRNQQEAILGKNIPEQKNQSVNIENASGTFITTVGSNGTKINIQNDTEGKQKKRK